MKKFKYMINHFQKNTKEKTKEKTDKRERENESTPSFCITNTHLPSTLFNKKNHKKKLLKQIIKKNNYKYSTTLIK